MSEKREELNKATTRGLSSAGGSVSGSSSTAAAAIMAPPSLSTTPIGPRHTPPSGGLLMAGPLSGQYAGTVRLRNPHPHDVLCGRGGSINSHPGNIRFRDWVKVRKQAYNLATSKVSKARMCREVFNLVRGLEPPGRFLQRMDDAGITGGAGGCWWMEINEQKALAKTSQALREGAPKIREMHKTEGTPPPLERKRSSSRGTKRKAAAKEPPAKRVKRGSVVGAKETKTNRSIEASHPAEMIQMTPTSLEAAAEVARTGLPQLPFYNALVPLPVLPSGDNAQHETKVAEDTVASNDKGPVSAPVTPGTDLHGYTPALAPVSPLFLSPIGNGSIPPDLNPPALSLGDASSPSSNQLPPLDDRGRMKRSHSLENHELEGGTFEFQDPFKDESHILSGKALRSPRPGNSEGNQQPSNDGEHRANDIHRSVMEKKVHNIIEHDHDMDGHGQPVQQNGKNCFCLCGTPGNHCICSDLADHLLHRSDGLDELNLISGC